MRIRVIAFRDYLADGDSAMMTTDFFRLPEQSKDFERCVKSIHAKGGGDTPEDGLELWDMQLSQNGLREAIKEEI